MIHPAALQSCPGSLGKAQCSSTDKNHRGADTGTGLAISQQKDDLQHLGRHSVSLELQLLLLKSFQSESCHGEQVQHQ